MEILLLIARLLLTAVFGTAGVTKAIDRDGTSRALIGFGVPESLAKPFGWLLPVIEIGVAVALLPLATAWVGAIAAFSLLLIFTTAMGVSLARGQAPDCHCFGAIHSEPVSGSTIARNVSLMAVAGLIILQGKEQAGASAINWLTELKTSEAINLCLMLTAIGLLTAAVVLIRRTFTQQATLLAKMEAIRITLDLEENFENIVLNREEATLPDEGLPVGAMAPAFSLIGVDDEHLNRTITLDDLLADGKPIMLFFASPNCVPCKSLLPAVKAWEREYGDRLAFVVISKGKSDETFDHMTKYNLNHLLQADSSVADAYRSRWTPGAVLIDADGKIASEMTYGEDEIRKVFNGIIASDEFQAMAAKVSGATVRRLPVLKTKSVLQLGEPAPAFALPDLQGRIVHSKDLFTKPTILLFWHPECIFCRKMVDYMKIWEQAPLDSSRQLVYISYGDTRQTREMNGNLQSLTLMDPDFNAGFLYGGRHTPSAILIEPGGKIASSLAVGDNSVLALLGPCQAEMQTALSA